MRQKSVSDVSRRLRTVELTPEFVELDWCRKGHVGYVLEGELELTFPDGPRCFAAGQAFMLAGDDEADKHRARSISPRTVLLIVD